MWPCTLSCPLLAQYDPLWFLFTYVPSCLSFISPQSVFWKQKWSHIRNPSFVFLVSAFFLLTLLQSPHQFSWVKVCQTTLQTSELSSSLDCMSFLSSPLFLSLSLCLSQISLCMSLSQFTYIFIYIHRYMKYKHITVCRYHLSMSFDIYVCVCVYTNDDI